MRVTPASKFGGRRRNQSMSIQLAFKNEKLRQICESPVSAKRKLGPAAGRSLHARLADLRAADSPVELIALGFAKYDAELEVRIVIHLDGGYVVIAEANHREAPGGRGALDWTQVTRLKIIHIGPENEN